MEPDETLLAVAREPEAHRAGNRIMSKPKPLISTLQWILIAQGQ